MKRITIVTVISILVILVVGGVVAIGIPNSPIANFLNFNKKSAQNRDVLLIVNGEKIYNSYVDVQRNYNKLIADIYKTQDEYQNLPEDQKWVIDKQYEELISKKDSEIIKDLIKSVVMVQEAEKIGIAADYEDSYKAQKNNFNHLKSVNDENYKFIASYIKSMEISEEEYLKLAADSYRKYASKLNLQKYYNETIANSDGGYKNFDEYVQALISDASIQYTELYYKKINQTE